MNGRSSFELFCVDVRPDEQGNYRVHRYGCPQFPDEYEFLGTFLSGRQAVQIAKARGYGAASGCIHCNQAGHTS